jgi:hypothetical protein
MEFRREEEPSNVAYCRDSLSKSVSDEKSPVNFKRTLLEMSAD